jgi:sulfide:quinone oxidoreductase
MSQKHHQIIVIGGGTGGIMTAAQLIRKSKIKLDVAIIDPTEVHAYQPAYTLVGAGTFKMKATQRPEVKQIPAGATWIKDSVIALDPDNNKVKTEINGEISYDYLILSPGVKYDLSLVEGLTEAMDMHDVCSNYMDPEKTWKVVQNFKGGNALYTQANTPIKCGGAPQKAMYLGEDYFRKNKALRAKTNVIYAFPGSVVFGVEIFKKRLLEICDSRGIILKHMHQLYKVDGEKKIAYFKFPNDQNYSTLTRNDEANKVGAQMKDGIIEIKYDMMHLAPPTVTPKFLSESKLAYQDGPTKGFAKVDIHTLQSPDYPNVFGVGDAMGTPNAKTGAAIRKQAPVLVDHLLAVMEHKTSTKSYNGYSSCPIVTGYGKMLLCEFDYDNQRDSDPLLSKFVDTTKDSYSMWVLKKYGLPYLYWNQMLKGKM